MSRQQRSSGDDWKIALEPASRYSKSAAATLCSAAVSDAMRAAARSSSESEKPSTASLQAVSTSLYQYVRADLTSASARAFDHAAIDTLCLGPVYKDAVSKHS